MMRASWRDGDETQGRHGHYQTHRLDEGSHTALLSLRELAEAAVRILALATIMWCVPADAASFVRESPLSRSNNPRKSGQNSRSI